MHRGTSKRTDSTSEFKIVTDVRNFFISAKSETGDKWLPTFVLHMRLITKSHRISGMMLAINNYHINSIVPFNFYTYRWLKLVSRQLSISAICNGGSLVLILFFSDTSSGDWGNCRNKKVNLNDINTNHNESGRSIQSSAWIALTINKHQLTHRGNGRLTQFN